MDSYPFLKLIHILSATLMIGTGLGSAFYLFFTYKKLHFESLQNVLKLVIKADLIFTTPSVIIQVVTGIMLSNMLRLTYTNWFWVALSASLLMIVLWVRAAFVQVTLKKLLEKEKTISKRFHRGMKIWFYLGVPSFFLALYLYYLMVYKPFVS